MRREPIERLLQNLKFEIRSRNLLVEVVYPKPTVAMATAIEELQGIWFSSGKNVPKLQNCQKIKFAADTKSVTQFEFSHTDCFAKKGLSVRTEADNKSGLVPMRYRPALNWAIRRLNDLEINSTSFEGIPRFFGILAAIPTVSGAHEDC